MIEEDFQMVMKKKIDEYLEYGKELGFFSQKNAKRVKERIQRIEFVQDNEIEGDASTILDRKDKKTTILVNMNRTFSNNNSEWFSDEVLFRELTHAISGLAENEFETFYSWYIDKNIQSFLTPTEKQEFEVYSKNKPFEFAAGYGVALLDDFVAQYMAQSMVEKKYGKILYPKKLQTKKSYLPEHNFYSTFSNYPIYEGFGKKFVEALYGEQNIERFCVESMDEKIVNNILENYKNRKKGGMENIYKILTQLGTIYFAENVSLGNFPLNILSQDPEKYTQNSTKMKKTVFELLLVLNAEVSRAKRLSDLKIK